MKNLKMRKLVAIIMAFCLMISSCVAGQLAVLADDAIAYVFDEDTGVLTISGEGAIDDYDENSLESIPWVSIRSKVKSIEIEPGITHIGSYAFCREAALVSVSIPDSVTSIGTAAFAGCTELKEIEIPDSVTEIGSFAFGYAYDMSLTDGFVTYCSPNSAAQRYCLRSYVPFEAPFSAEGVGHAEITEENGQTMWSFVPAVDGTITFWSESTDDTYGLIYDASDYTWMATNDEHFDEMLNSAIAKHDDISNSNCNFRVVKAIEAGKRYYLSAKFRFPGKKNAGFAVKMSFECDEHIYEIINATATCTEAGETTYKCQGCGAEYTEQTEAYDHDVNETPVIENVVEATCTVLGSYDEVYYCKRCGEEVGRDPQSTIYAPHNYVAIDTVEPSCDQQGYTTYECTVCKGTYNYDYQDATGHTPAESVVENRHPASCQSAGTYDEVVYCSVCNKELNRDTKPINQLEHTPGEITEENNTNPTCTQPGYYDEVIRCTECNEIIYENRVYSDASGHSYSAIDFANGEVGVVCANCDNYKTITFMDYLNQENPLLDIVEDGIVNAKDYAKFRREYPAPDVACDIDLSAKTVSRDNAVLEDGVLTLTPSGRYAFYNITGESDDVRIVVNANKDVEIRFINANMTVDNANAIVINNTATDGTVPDVSISAAEGTENFITVTTKGNAITNYSDAGACKLELKGHGLLKLDTASTAINSGAKITIKNINLNITAANRGIDTKFTIDGVDDYASISVKGNATITVNSNDDGIRCNNFTTEALEAGDTDSIINITSASADGIQMEGKKSVLNTGVFNIEANAYAFNCKAANFTIKAGAKINANAGNGLCKQ